MNARKLAKSGCRQPSTVHICCYRLCHIQTDLMQITFHDGIFMRQPNKPHNENESDKKWKITSLKARRKNFAWTQSIFNFSVFFSRFLFVCVCVCGVTKKNEICVENTKAVMKCEKVRTECNLWNSFCQFTNIVRLVCDSCAPEKKNQNMNNLFFWFHSHASDVLNVLNFAHWNAH